MNKQQLVDAINSYPGPEVTTRARKDTLLEILEERKMARKKNPYKAAAIFAVLGIVIIVVMANVL